MTIQDRICSYGTCTALGMSYYSASMSWDLTRLTSSKVVAHNTCSTGTATDTCTAVDLEFTGTTGTSSTGTGTSTGSVPRGLVSRPSYCYRAVLKSVERYKLPCYRDLAPVFFWGMGCRT